MPNLNAPYGLAPFCYRNGTPWNGGARLYSIAPADTNSFYIGDPVKIVANADANGIPVVTIATAGATMRGVVVGVGIQVQGGALQGGPYVNPNNLGQTWRPAAAQTTFWYALVVDDPNVIFSIMEASGTPGTTAQISSKNANFVYTAPTAGTNFLSITTLDPTTYAVTATLNLKLMGAVQDFQNVPLTANQRLLVTINNHDFSTGVAGI